MKCGEEDEGGETALVELAEWAAPKSKIKLKEKGLKDLQWYRAWSFVKAPKPAKVP